jgi:hypothetical protein
LVDLVKKAKIEKRKQEDKKKLLTKDIEKIQNKTNKIDEQKKFKGEKQINT